MKQTINVGYIQTPSVTHLANVKQTLVETGVVSTTTPNEMLPTAIKEGMQGFVKPTGTLLIEENGEYDVTDKASVVVNISGGSTVEEWDGAYEEISSGFTLTLNTNTDGIALSGSGIYYSLDNGSSWNEITLETLTLENATQIKFKSEFTYGMLNIGTTEDGSDIYSELGYQVETDNITLDKDTTIYITNIGYPGM